MTSQSPSSSKAFVWGWGRLTPSPLLLTPAHQKAEDAARLQTPLKASDSNGSATPQQPPEAQYPFPSTARATTCTLSPTLVEAMETHSVRAIHTAAYHTVAITHSGGLYSWLHAGGAGTRPDGPATEEPSPTTKHMSVTQVSRSRSKPGSRADSPVQGSTSKIDASQAGRERLVTSFAANSVPVHSAPEKKFRRVVVSTGKSLGLGHTPVPPPAISAASVGRSQMLAVTTAGQVLQWDWSATEQVAPLPSFSSPPTSSISSPSSPPLAPRGPSVLHLPSSTSGMGPTLVNGLACGGQFSLLVTGEGSAYSWGKLGTHGRLGQGAPLILSSPTAVKNNSPPSTPEKQHQSLATSLMTPPRLRSDSPVMEKHSGPVPRQLAITTPEYIISKAAAGWAHGALVLATGGVATFGCGLGGRLGSGNQLDQWTPQPVVGLDSIQIVEVACGYHHTMAVDVSGRVWAFGSNEHGQLGLGDRQPRATPDSLISAFPDEVVAVACGAFHSAVITAVGDLYTFGCGRYGQLGFGDTKSSSVPRLVSSLNGMDVCLVACGGDYTVAVTDHFAVMQMDYFGGDSRSASTINLAGLDQDNDFTPPPQMTASQLRSMERSRSGSITLGVNLPSTPASPAQQLSPTHVLTPLAARRSSSGSVLPPPHPASPSPSAFIFSSPVGGGVNGPPPTPVIFEERDSAAQHPTTSGNFVPYPRPVAGAEDEEPLRGVRSSPSNSALADLTNPSSLGSGSSSLTRSNSFAKLNGGGVFETPTPGVGGVQGSAYNTPRRGSTFSTEVASPGMVAPVAQRTIFQLVKDVFSLPEIALPDLRMYMPTAKPTSSLDPPDLSDTAGAGLGLNLGSLNLSGLGSPGEDSIAALSEFRPVNLGKKSSAEVARQHDEVQRMNQAYKVKLRKEAKGKALLREQEEARRKVQEKESKELAKRNLVREHRMDEAAEVWLKQIVPSWSSASRAKKTRELVARVGVPPRVRGVVWPLALGNALMITPELYEIFGQQASRARKRRVAELRALNNAQERYQQATSSSATPATPASPSSSSIASSSSSGGGNLISSPSFTLGKESTFSYIDVDLTRTYPSLAFFQEECPMNDQLRHLLYTYCHYRPDVGYVQGMSYLAGNLLLYMTPFDAFVSFAHLLNSPFFHVFLKLESAKMAARYRIFEELFLDAEPELFKHFQQENIGSELYFMEWCMTLFSKRLQLDVVGRVWDNYLMIGEVVVYRTGVAILKAMKQELIGTPFDQIMKKLNATPLELSEESLMNAMSDIKLSSSLRAKLKAINPLLPDE